VLALHISQFRLSQQLTDTNNYIHWRPDLVALVREKITLGPVGLIGLFFGLLMLPLGGQFLGKTQPLPSYPPLQLEQNWKTSTSWVPFAVSAQESKPISNFHPACWTEKNYLWAAGGPPPLCCAIAKSRRRWKLDISSA
jgi:hypothetical protein